MKPWERGRLPWSRPGAALEPPWERGRVDRRAPGDRWVISAVPARMAGVVAGGWCVPGRRKTPGRGPAVPPRALVRGGGPSWPALARLVPRPGARQGRGLSAFAGPPARSPGGGRSSPGSGPGAGLGAGRQSCWGVCVVRRGCLGGRGSGPLFACLRRVPPLQRRGGDLGERPAPGWGAAYNVPTRERGSFSCFMSALRRFWRGFRQMSGMYCWAPWNTGRYRRPSWFAWRKPDGARPGGQIQMPGRTRPGGCWWAPGCPGRRRSGTGGVPGKRGCLCTGLSAMRWSGSTGDCKTRAREVLCKRWFESGGGDIERLFDRC